MNADSKDTEDVSTDQDKGTRNIYVSREKLFEKRGILDPDGESVNPLTNEPYINMYTDTDGRTYSDYGDLWSNTPMYAVREKVITTIYDNQVTLIISGTGSGKTVLTPKFALHVLNYEGRIAITNPKQTPTEENGRRSAQNLDVELGSAVGIKYRNSNKEWISDSTKLVYCTDGTILAKIRKDSMLSEFDCVIIDEAHERGLNIDLLLLLLKDLVKKRPDFRLIIMSATINEDIFVNYFQKDDIRFATVNAGQETMYPIEEIFSERSLIDFKEGGKIANKNYVEEAAKKAVEVLVNTHDGARGDLLIFVGGDPETKTGCQYVREEIKRINGNQSPEQMDQTDDTKIRVYCDSLTSKTRPDIKKLLITPELYKKDGLYNRKVIFATNVAESSITVNGIDHVIDSGVQHIGKFYPDSNLQCIERTTISKASHRQRMGRTGRISPGTCYNLFTKDEYSKYFDDYAESSIYMSDVSEFIMSFLTSDSVTHVNIPFKYDEHEYESETTSLAHYLSRLIERPHERSVQACLSQFFLYGAIEMEGGGLDNGVGKAYVTTKGRMMSKFIIEPNMSSMLIESHKYGSRCVEDMLTIIALLSNSENKMDKYFVGLQSLTGKHKNDMKRKREIEKSYNRVMGKFSHNMGDIMTLFYVYRQFRERMQAYKKGRLNKESELEKENEDEGSDSEKNEEEASRGFVSAGAVDVGHSDGEEESQDTEGLSNADESSVSGEGSSSNVVKEWCLENYLRYNEFSKIESVRRRLRGQWQRELRSSPLPDESEDSGVFDNDDDKVLMSLFTSNMHNYVKKADDGGMYQTCAHLVSVSAPLDDNNRSMSTFVHYLSNGGNIDSGICMKMMSIFDKKRFMMMTLLTREVESELRKSGRFVKILDKRVERIPKEYGERGRYNRGDSRRGTFKNKRWRGNIRTRGRENRDMGNRGRMRGRRNTRGKSYGKSSMKGNNGKKWWTGIFERKSRQQGGKGRGRNVSRARMRCVSSRRTMRRRGRNTKVRSRRVKGGGR